MVEVEGCLEAGPEADLEAAGAQQEGLQPVEAYQVGLQPVEGPAEGPLEGLVGREEVAQEAHSNEAYDGVSIVTMYIQIVNSMILGLVLLQCHHLH